MTLKRGNLVSVQHGTAFLSKPRPAVVIQATECLAMRDSVTICLLTSVHDEDFPVRPVLSPSKLNKLEKVSAVQIDKVMTVPRAAVSDPWGSVSAADLKKISLAVAFWLGLS